MAKRSSLLWCIGALVLASCGGPNQDGSADADSSGPDESDDSMGVDAVGDDRSDSNPESESGSDIPQPQPDTPGECEVPNGVAVSLENDALWTFATPESPGFLHGHLDGDLGVVGGGVDQWKLVEFDTLMGPIHEATVESYSQTGGRFYRRPTGELVLSQGIDRDIYIREFLELEYLDETVLSDDHPNPAQYNVRSRAVSLDLYETSFRVLGSSWSSTDVEGDEVLAMYWVNTYEYGNPEPLDSVHAGEPTDNPEDTGGVAWQAGEPVISIGGLIDHLVRLGSGSEATVINDQFSSLARLTDSREGEALYRVTEDSPYNEDGNGSVVYLLDITAPGTASPLWRDRFCERQQAYAASFVRGGAELVVGTATQEGDNLFWWFHRVDRDSTSVLESVQVTAPAGYELGKVLIFETEEEEVGVVLYGGENLGGGMYEARAASVLLPFSG